MNTRFISSAILAAAFCTSAVAAPAPQGDVARGKEAFMRIGCYTCHGYEAQGVPGRKLAPNPIPYPAFSAFVRTSTGDMPTFTPKVVPEQELMDIYAYIQTLPVAKPPAPNSIPLLQQIGG